MKCVALLGATVVAPWLGCALGLGQQIANEAPEPERLGAVFSVTSTLVQIDAVVTDSKGRHVTDLKADDFEVYEDGNLQRLIHFSYVDVGAPKVPPAKLRRPAEGSQQQAAPPVSPMRREELRRVIVLMVDDLGLSFESMAYVRRAVRKFIDSQMEPGDLVAICRTASGSSALHRLTNDKRMLLSIADGLRWNPNGRYGTGVFAPIGVYRVGNDPGVPSGDFRSRDATFEAERSVMFTVGTLGAVEATVMALRDLPGRKSIVLFSDGMNLRADDEGPVMHSGAGGNPGGSGANIFEALRKLIDRANRAGTVVYTVHAQGLQTLQPDAQDNPHLGGLPNVSAEQRLGILKGMIDVGVRGGRDQQFNAGQQGLSYLAYQTGGVPYENGNDMNWGLQRVLEDQRGYYLLGYRPSESTFREKHGQRGYHQITVRVRRAGLHVRTRTGFFGETDKEARPRFSSPVDELRAAMTSPFQESGMRLRLTALYARSRSNGDAVRNLLHIDPRDIDFAHNSDGSLSGKVSLVVLATRMDDLPLASLGQSYNIEVPAEHVDRMMAEGALYVLDVPVKNAGGYQIRVAVRDERSGKIGSASQFLEIPNLKKRRFALSSVVLQDAERPRSDSDIPGITAARRQFRRGKGIEYLCLVHGGPPKLEAQVRLFRGDQQVYAGSAHVVNSGDSRAVTGVFKLAAAITPGEYYMQVVAGDASPKKQPVFGQWTDFEVLP